MKYKLNLGEIKKRNQKSTKWEKHAIHNIETLCKARNNVIKFFYDYSSIISEAKHKATKNEGLKISTPKQIPQRLTITLHK